jgi:transcriptional regulator with XRE-family HTH domain
MVDIEKFSRTLKYKRGSKSLREIAEEVGVSISTLSRAEQGKTSDLNSFFKICHAYDLNPSDFFLEEKTTNTTYSDCGSENGITIGLIDGIITICRVLAPRDFNDKDVQEALKDLSTDDDLNYILNTIKHKS